MQGLQYISDRGLSFDLQIIPELSEACAAVFSQFPNLQVILCHAGSPYNRTEEGITSWASDLNHLSNLSNVSCKLSGLGMFEHNWTQSTVSPIVTTVMKQFGSQRVMFGSNFPVDSLSSSFKELFERERSTEDDEPKLILQSIHSTRRNLVLESVGIVVKHSRESAHLSLWPLRRLLL